MSVALAPPGYASPRREVPSGVEAFAAVLVLTLIVAFYELGLAQARIYAPTSLRAGALWAALIAMGLGFFIALRLRNPARYLEAALGCLSLFASGAGHAWMAAFPRGNWLQIAAICLPAVGAALVGISIGLSVRSFGRELAWSGTVIRFMSPFRLGVTGAALVAALSSFPLLGVLGRAGLLGAVLAGLAAFAPLCAHRLGLDAALSRFSHWLTSTSALAALVSVSFLTDRTPPEDIRQHAGEVAFVLDTERGHHVISSIQGGLVLFSNGVLSLTHADNARFAEALVHPAMVVTRSPKNILAFDDGIGAIEREILRWPEVERIVSVPRDPTLHALARKSLWFLGEGASAFSHRKVAVRFEEPSAFLATTNARYDVILADFGDPHSYIEAKYLTRYWFRSLRTRLAPGGVLAVQATSPLRTPRTFATILLTLQAAGFTVLDYRAPLPTLGEWGFALAVDAEQQSLDALKAKIREPRALPGGTAFVTAATLPGLFAAPPAPSAEPGVVSTLHDQGIVDAYQSEDREFSGL